MDDDDDDDAKQDEDYEFQQMFTFDMDGIITNDKPYQIEWNVHILPKPRYK